MRHQEESDEHGMRTRSPHRRRKASARSAATTHLHRIDKAAQRRHQHARVHWAHLPLHRTPQLAHRTKSLLREPPPSEHEQK